MSNDKIKYPVRVMPNTCCLIIDNEECLLGSVNNSHHRDEFIHALNGYDEFKGKYYVAVKALQLIYSDGDGWGKSLAWEALRDLGELNEQEDK